MKPSGIPMARNVRVEILRRAREILSDSSNWGRSYLRQMVDGKPKYCVLGAVEQAAYDLGYATEMPGNSFDESDWQYDGAGPLAYRLGNEVSLNSFAREQGFENIWSANDGAGYEKTLSLLDGYITEVEAGRAREPELTDEDLMDTP